MLVMLSDPHNDPLNDFLAINSWWLSLVVVLLIVIVIVSIFFSSKFKKEKNAKLTNNDNIEK